MRSSLVLAVLIASLACIGLALAQNSNAPRPAASPLADGKAKLSYSIGYQIGRDMKRSSVDIDAQTLLKGIQDGSGGAKPLLTDAEMEQVIRAFQQEAIAKIPEKNKKEGDAFLATNGKVQGVTTLKSGLQYKVVKDGTGRTPKATDRVKAHYRGTLIDGTQFDSSYDRGEPLAIAVNGVIPGWTEALQLMKEGSKWQLFIPANLAYGERGAPPDIGPNSTLIFDVELIAIE